MNFLMIALFAQLAAPARQAPPVLAFPEAGLDDTAAYRGYSTRFFRDASGNTVQIYLDRREGRIVHLWADAENESIGLTARDSAGRIVGLNWGGTGAAVSRAGRARTVEYALVADAPVVQLGHFLLGSMRVERDFQAWGHHRGRLDTAAYVLPELERLMATFARLAPAERRRHTMLLRAADERTLDARLRPVVSTRVQGSRWTTRILQQTIDARDTIALEIAVDARRVIAAREGNVLSLRSRTGAPVPFTLRIATTGRALTPLTRREIFTPGFLAFVDSARRATGDSAAIRGRWIERQVRGAELLSSREKLMAGLPTYATYFGRDMQVTALMMRPIWRPEMLEFVVGSVLRKLSASGEVSHEEALGGQAVRESASEYVALVDAHLAAAARGDRAAADGFLSRSRTVLSSARRVRENYHMIDDELQFPIIVMHWLQDSRVSVARKRAFLLDSSDGGETRLHRLLRELALVARMTEAYARNPVASNLISFAPRDSGRWASTSWRDSNAGYANGRYAMDVNAIWAPHALEAVARIVDILRAPGFLPRGVRLPLVAPDTPLGRHLADPRALRSAADTWWDASRHFVIRLDAAETRARVNARLAAMPAVEREHWAGVLRTTNADATPLTFMALALDSEARPIGVVNSDVATGFVLGSRPSGSPLPGAAEMESILRDVRTFVRAYPVGLLVDRIGPVAANDAFATAPVWTSFVRDAYHGPRVVWGREVNLFLLGVASRIAAVGDSSTTPAHGAYVRELRSAAARVQAAAEGSGFQSELWSYDFVNGRPVPVRYGSGADVQLWSTTDLVVQWALSRMR